MKSKAKILSVICAGAVALTLLMALSAPRIGQETSPQPAVRPVCDFTQEDRATPPHKPKPTPVDEETANVEPTGTPPTEINFEPPEPRGGTAIPPLQEPPRDKPTPSATAPQTTPTVTTAEPQMGDTRTEDGQKQIHILGFGWIEDNGTSTECIYAKDIYENGNKIGSMGGGIFVDGDGDINKMIGNIDE